jgi:hypothetical protein
VAMESSVICYNKRLHQSFIFFYAKSSIAANFPHILLSILMFVLLHGIRGNGLGQEWNGDLQRVSVCIHSLGWD